MYSSQAEDELTEVLVCPNQQRIVFVRPAQDRVIVDAWTQLDDVEHLMTITP